MGDCIGSRGELDTHNMADALTCLFFYRDNEVNDLNVEIRLIFS